MGIKHRADSRFRKFSALKNSVLGGQLSASKPACRQAGRQLLVAGNRFTT